MKTRMQMIEDELQSDPFEQEIIRAKRKEYIKTKRKEKIHSINRQYSGETNELLFKNYIDFLYESGYLQYYKWLSYHAKTEYDFEIQLKDSRIIYIDVVGTQLRNTTITLNCSHKDYKPKIKALSPGDKGYLAFELKGEWRFLQISRHLPKGDIFMSKARNKHVKTPGYVFNTPLLCENTPQDEKNLLSESARNVVNMHQSEVF